MNPTVPADTIAAAKESFILAHPYDPNTPLVLNPPANAPESAVANIPVALAPLSPDYPQLFPEVPMLDALAEAFNDDLEKDGYHPSSPDAEETWEEKKRKSDDLFRLFYGDAAYVKMDQQRVHGTLE